MKNFFHLSIGNRIAIFSLIVAIVTLFCGVYQHLDNKQEAEQKMGTNTSIVTGDDSAVVSGASGDVTINYSSK